MKFFVYLLLFAIYLPYCEASSAPMEESYDIIIVGAGTAGSIVAARLVEELDEKKILLVDAGGPLSSKNGGSEVPSYFRGEANPPTIFDIPGEFGMIFDKKYRSSYSVQQTPYYIQGKGYGGTSQINGMCCQLPPPSDFSKWPEKWRWQDLAPYFKRVLERVKVTTAPSLNGVRYDRERGDIFIEIAKKNNMKEGDTLDLERGGKEFYGYLSVASDRGERGGPVSGYLSKIIDNRGEAKKKNLKLLPHSTVEEILFEGTRASAILLRDASGEKKKISLSEKGRLIMAAGSLNTPRLLLLSGIGPDNCEKNIFGKATNRKFHIINNRVGNALHDHYALKLNLRYSGVVPQEAMSREEVEALYKREKSGPYAQYGPALLLFGSTDGIKRDFEVMVAGMGSARTRAPFSKSRSIELYVIPFYTEKRCLVNIDKSGNLVGIHPHFSEYPSDMKGAAKALQRLLSWVKADKNLSIVMENNEAIDLNNPSLPLHLLESYLAPPERMVKFNHIAGGCPLHDISGTDPSTLKVRGVDNLYVVDASLIPSPLGAHPILTAMAMAEKAAEMLLSEP